MSELLAKLSVRTMPLNFGGFGGVCEVTAQDVAAALGMCANKFAVLVFLRKNGVDLPEVRNLDHELANLQWDEWKSRADDLIVAQLRLAEAQLMFGIRALFRTRAAHAAIENARAKMWPELREDIYSRIRHAAIEDVCDPHTCRRCSGRKEFFAGELKIVCPVCGGTGSKPPSARGIAGKIGVTRDALPRWMPVWNWTVDKLFEAKKKGGEEFAKFMEIA